MRRCQNSQGGAGKVVAVYPEVYFARCPNDPSRYVHVLWVLAPFGTVNIEPLRDGAAERIWEYDDLVFHYNMPTNGATAVPVPLSNMLTVFNDPQVSDGFEIWKYEPLPRRGTVFMMRKAELFHGHNLTKQHPSAAFELTHGHSMQEHITAFRTHTFFVCYDPFSYYVFIAAMLGCIPVVIPMANHTKRQWLSKTFLHEYFEHAGISNVAGIAYGWDDVPHARRTMRHTRNQLWDSKEFAHSVTVPRFVRDVKRAASGQRDGFESAMWSHDVYPRWWLASWRRKERERDSPAGHVSMSRWASHRRDEQRWSSRAWSSRVPRWGRMEWNRVVESRIA